MDTNISEQEHLKKFQDEIKQNPFLKRFNLELYNKHYYLFFKILSILFIVMALIISGFIVYYIQAGKFQSIFNSNQSCGSLTCSALTCQTPVCSPTLTCPTIPTIVCPALTCKCGNSTT
jgi:uncharacterized membrane protein YraQ (UPF0718 family)